MHPFLRVLIEVLLLILVVGFTSPNSYLRLIAFFLVFYCTLCCLPKCMEYMQRTPWAALLGGASVSYLYHYADVALFSRWSFLTGTPTSDLIRATWKTDSVAMKASNAPCGEMSALTQRLKFGVKLATTFRFTGTPFQVQNVAAVSTTDYRTFIWRKLSIIALCYFALDAINSSADLEISRRYLTTDKVPVLTRVSTISAEELTIRIFAVSAAGISLNCVQGGIYNVFALFSVACGFSKPGDWPPFYGSLGSAYTLRRFWNVFWHQTNARKFASIAHFLVHKVLRQPRGTAVSRYLRLVAAFSASAIMHVMIDFSAGISLQQSGAVQFFVTQAIGMIVGDAVMALWVWYYGTQTQTKSWQRVLGYVWVAGFMVWSAPVYLYPMMWRVIMGENDSVIPFSIFEASGGRRA